MNIEFNSGGTEGFRLNQEIYNIPDHTNLYGVLEGGMSKLEVATKFHEFGWSVRKSSFTDYEIEAEWAELNIEGDNEVLISGAIDEHKLGEFSIILDNFGLRFSLELYDDGHKLIKTISSG